jgi:hypothetical protein
MKTAMICLGLLFAGCASKNKQDHVGLEKYRQCYHHNVKISKACIEKNENGEPVTALQLENAAYPGQYK